MEFFLNYCEDIFWELNCIFLIINLHFVNIFVWTKKKNFLCKKCLQNHWSYLWWIFYTICICKKWFLHICFSTNMCSFYLTRKFYILESGKFGISLPLQFLFRSCNENNSNKLKYISKKSSKIFNPSKKICEFFNEYDDSNI